MLRRLASAAVLACAYLAITATSAFAEGCPPGQTPAPAPGGGVICIVATDPGTPDEPEHDGPNTPASQTCHRSE